jgi:flagellar biosynthetic protein FliR
VAGLYQFPEGQILAFALVLMRIIAFVATWPVFGSANVPMPVKLLLSILFTMVVFPTLHFTNTDLITMNDELLLLSAREIFIGFSLGFLMRMFFFIVSIMGEIVSVTMGLSAAQLYNPAMGSQASVLEQFEVTLATLLFLALNGHHIFIGGLVQSFSVAPVASLSLNYHAFATIGAAAQEIMVIGLKMSAPVLVAIFLTNLSMGILGRAVPQINVLITSMPVTALLGLLILIITTPLFVNEMGGMIDVMAERFFQFMKVI